MCGCSGRRNHKGPVSPLRQTARVLTADNLDVTDALTWASAAIGAVTRANELSGGWTSTMLALSTEDGDEAVLRLKDARTLAQPMARLSQGESRRSNSCWRTPAFLHLVPAHWTPMVASAAFLPT